MYRNFIQKLTPEAPQCILPSIVKVSLRLQFQCRRKQGDVPWDYRYGSNRLHVEPTGQSRDASYDADEYGEAHQYHVKTVQPPSPSSVMLNRGL
jgi:hypothetical protein